MDASNFGNPEFKSTTTVPAPSSSQHPMMALSSPPSGVILPPPIPHDHSKSTSPRTSLTLPPLSTLSPLMRPSTGTKPSTPIITTSLSNLIHPEKRGESSTPSYRRESRELSPRAKARRESMNMEAPRLAFPFETIDEHSVLQGQQGARRPRRSMPASAGERSYTQQPYAPYLSGHPFNHPSQAGPSGSQPPPVPRFPPGPASGTPGGEEWAQRPTRPSVEVNPRPRTSVPQIPTHGPWFTIDDTPTRNQAGWSQAQLEIYNAGWADALRAVEAGTIGIGGQQYSHPQYIPREQAYRTQPPPLRQSSSSDPGPPNYPTPFDQRHPRSMSFGSAYSPQPPHRHHPYAPYPHAASGSGRASISYPSGSVSGQANQQWTETHTPGYRPPPPERHSYSSTSTSVSHSPTSPRPGMSIFNDRDRDPLGSSHGHGHGHGKHQSRQAISCFPCRTRKLKCNGQKPCSQCTRRGGDDGCRFAESVKRRGKGKKDKSKSEEEEDRVREREGGSGSGESRDGTEVPIGSGE